MARTDFAAPRQAGNGTEAGIPLKAARTKPYGLKIR